MDRKTITALLDEHLPTLGAQHRRYILEAAAISAYQAQHAFPIVQLLLADDAHQFKRVTEELAACTLKLSKLIQVSFNGFLSSNSYTRLSLF